MADDSGELASKKISIEPTASLKKKDSTISTFTPDLGDDLIRTQINLQPDKEEIEKSDRSPWEDELADELPESMVSSAEILFSEGLLPQAKRLARAALLRDSGLIQAKKLLQKIDEKEVQELFRSEKLKVSKAPTVSPWMSLERAEKERKALFDFLKISESDSVVLQHEEELAFTDFLVKTYSSATPAQHLDLGLALMEMELFRWARDQFQAARREETLEALANCLIGQCYVLANQPYDALQELEPVALRGGLKEEEKLEVFYWIARAYEALGRPKDAILWYDNVHAVKPDYRDEVDRRALCVRKHSSSS